jgi:hypothetical protein
VVVGVGGGAGKALVEKDAEIAELRAALKETKEVGPCPSPPPLPSHKPPPGRLCACRAPTGSFSWLLRRLRAAPQTTNS